MKGHFMIYKVIVQSYPPPSRKENLKMYSFGELE